VSPVGRRLQVDAGALGREIVLENDVVFGSVNADLHHYQLAAHSLASADRDWLEGLISRRVPLDRFREALDRGPDDVKVVIELDGGG
jgi:glucose 1-dehydrogenase